MEILVLILIVVVYFWWRSQKAKAIKSKQPPTLPRGVGRSRSAGSTQIFRQNDSRWTPLGETITVAGRELSGGVYVGTSLSGVGEYQSSEPALINIRLEVADRNPDLLGETMGYWPSYAEITPDARAAYLDWLASGRGPGAYIGYVFLFFYGIERRVLVDAQSNTAARDEVPDLLAEVQRLITLYGDNASFRGYASSFSAIANLMHLSGDTDTLVPPKDNSHWDVPVELKLKIGDLSKKGAPIPGEWALAWGTTHPEVYLRTPATRCSDEFSELFRLRYEERYAEGMKIRPGTKQVNLAYRPASASFDGAIEATVPEIPDVTSLRAPLDKLRALVDDVTNELDSYSRWIGRNGERESLNAVALLPAPLAKIRLPAHGVRLVEAVRAAADTTGNIETAVLVEAWPSAAPGRLSKREATSLATFLEQQGYGIEPDVRFGKINLSRHRSATIYRLIADADPGPGYEAATLLLHLGAAVSHADGSISSDEEHLLASHLELVLHLPDAGRQRLRAHLRWLLHEPPGLAGIKNRMAGLAQSQRAQIGKFLLTVAGADGRVEPGEVKVLSKIYPLLGLDAERVHSDLHALAIGSATDPVSVISADADTGWVAIPTRPDDPEGVQLNPIRVAEVLGSTEQVADLLAEVFEGLAEREPEEPIEKETARILDVTHTALVRDLARRPVWAQADLDLLVGRAGVMAGGAIETINEAAFGLTGAPLIEGGDPVEIDGDILKELLDEL